MNRAVINISQSLSPCRSLVASQSETWPARVLYRRYQDRWQVSEDSLRQLDVVHGGEVGDEFTVVARPTLSLAVS